VGLRYIMISATTQLRSVGQPRLAERTGALARWSDASVSRLLRKGATQQPTGASRRSASNSTSPALAVAPPAPASSLLDSRPRPFKTHSFGVRPAA